MHRPPGGRGLIRCICMHVHVPVVASLYTCM
jgi:hypothetical protein